MAHQLSNMAFEVKNLGVVKQGKLTQQPLTILCGPNNSGKTWLMYSLYYCYKLIAHFDEYEIDSPFGDISEKTLRNLSKTINRDLVNVFNTSKDALNNASFIPQFSEEQFTQQIQNIRNTFLMPAERAGLHLFYRELSTRRTALLHHVSRKTSICGNCCGM